MMNPIDLAAQALATAEQGGQHLEIRIRFTPAGRIVRGGALGQPPQQAPPTFSAGIYEVGAGKDEHIIESRGGQMPDQALGKLALMIIQRGLQWFIPGDKPDLKIVPDDGEDESAPTPDEDPDRGPVEGGDDEPSEDAVAGMPIDERERPETETDAARLTRLSERPIEASTDGDDAPSAEIPEDGGDDQRAAEAPEAG